MTDNHPKDRTDDDWRRELTPEAYHVTREGGTERAFTGAYWNNHEPGVYRCVCCDAELFTSEHKFDSGSGWPSFWETLTGDRVKKIEDVSHGMVRTEVQCSACDAHLGHLFGRWPRADGPPLLHQLGGAAPRGRRAAQVAGHRVAGH